jgi:predicted anti-sigma-YlaC factor YlaD
MVFLLGIISGFPVTSSMMLMPSAHAGFILVVLIFRLPRPGLLEQDHIFLAIALDSQAHIPLATGFALVILAFRPRSPIAIAINEIIFSIAKLD